MSTSAGLVKSPGRVPSDLRRHSIVTALLLLAAVPGSLASLTACSKDESGATASQSAAPARLPDWRGVWSAYPNVFDGAYDPFKASDGPPAPGLLPPYKPEYMAQFQQHFQAFLSRKPLKGLNNGMFCTPSGVVGFMGGVYPMQFVIGPDLVAVLSEYDNKYRLIFTDGRPHRADADPTYRGDAIGHWEGETLVVETTNMRTDTALDGLGRNPQRPGTRRGTHSPRGCQLHGDRDCRS